VGQPVLAAVRQVLASRGSEPYDDGGTIQLHNCAFDRIAAQHPELVCGANLAIVEGLTDQLGSDQPSGPFSTPRPDVAALRSPAPQLTSTGGSTSSTGCWRPSRN
jgi:hypothetical protein